jgi:hypothetical protein
LKKYSLKIKINKKWLENQSNLKEDKYESPTLNYCREIGVMVPLMKVGLQTPHRIQGSWNDDNIGTLEVVVESSKGVDGKPNPSIKGSPQYYHI